MYGALRPGGRLLLQQMSRGPTPHRAAARSSRRTSLPTCICGRSWQTVRFVQDAGFEVRHVEAMREHYVRTAEHWLRHARADFDDFVALTGRGGGPGLAAVSGRRRAGFEQGRMGVDQILAAKS